MHNSSEVKFSCYFSYQMYLLFFDQISEDLCCLVKIIDISLFFSLITFLFFSLIIGKLLLHDHIKDDLLTYNYLEYLHFLKPL